jgi:SLT domain-containing protein
MARYGSPFNIPGLLSGSYVGYGAGTASAAPGWAWVGEHGPELMHFRGGEQVVPAGRGGGGDVYITVNVPPTVNPAHAGQQIANLLGAHIKRGGRIYPAGVTPR